MIFPGDRRTTFEDPVIGAFAASVRKSPERRTANFNRRNIRIVLSRPEACRLNDLFEARRKDDCRFAKCFHRIKENDDIVRRVESLRHALMRNAVAIRH